MDSIRSSDGTSIAFTRTGGGVPLLLIHGTAGSAARWAGVTPQLAQHFSVFALDRRGRGGSGDTQEYSLEREVDDAVALIDRAGQPAFVLGHSFGGLVALEAARQRPQIAGLILYEPPIRCAEPVFPAALIERLEQVLLDEGPEAVLEAFMMTVAGVTPAQLTVMKQAPAWPQRIASAHTLARELRASEQYDFIPERFRDLSVPVRLFLGSETVGFAKAGIERLAAVLPNSSTVMFAGQGHTAMDTDPEAFVAEVLSFATELTGALQR